MTDIVPYIVKKFSENWALVGEIHLQLENPDVHCHQSVADVEGNLERILFTTSRCLSWFSRLILSCMAASWFMRLFCISFSWSISLCSRTSSRACMAASISLSWEIVAVIKAETCSITVVFLVFVGTVDAGKRDHSARQWRHTGLEPGTPVKANGLSVEEGKWSALYIHSDSGNRTTNLMTWSY